VKKNKGMTPYSGSYAEQKRESMDIDPVDNLPGQWKVPVAWWKKYRN